MIKRTGCFKDREDWKETLSEFLKKMNIIDDKFTGKISIEINQGGVRNAEKSERWS